MNLYKEHGTKWQTISSFFDNRTCFSVRNRVNALLRNINKDNSRKEEEDSSPKAEERENNEDIFIDTSDITSDIFSDTNIFMDSFSFDII